MNKLYTIGILVLFAVSCQPENDIYPNIEFRKGTSELGIEYLTCDTAVKLGDAMVVMVKADCNNGSELSEFYCEFATKTIIHDTLLCDSYTVEIPIYKNQELQNVFQCRVRNANNKEKQLSLIIEMKDE